MGPGPAPWQGPPRLSPADCAVNKTRGLCHVHGPGEEVSPLSGCMEDSEPLGPLCQCLQISSPLLRGPGGPGLLLPTSVFSSPRRQVSLLPNWASKPRFCFGAGGTGFLLTLPCLGTVDTQVPCIEPSLLVSFSHIWADPRGTISPFPLLPFGLMVPHQGLHGREKKKVYYLHLYKSWGRSSGRNAPGPACPRLLHISLKPQVPPKPWGSAGCPHGAI